MKFFTPDRSELIDIASVTPEADGTIVISGRIMGAMPMKAVLRPEQLRAGFRLLSPGLVFALIAMLFRRSET
jgi:hypothetical protein